MLIIVEDFGWKIRVGEFGRAAENGSHRAGHGQRGQPERGHGGIAREISVARDTATALIQAASATTM
jgi:hypothetical protein